MLRPREDHPRISFLELLFDLGLIVALSRLSLRLLDDFSLVNALQTLVLLAAVWWVWTVTAYTTDWYDPEQGLVQLIVVGVLLSGYLMAMASVRAFEGLDGLAFAGAYVGLHLFRGLLLVTALRGHELRVRPLRVLIWFSATGLLWLGGAFLPAPARLAVWAVAITLDYLAGLFGYWVPKLGRIAARELRIIGEHISERYRQMFIVALGEILLVGALKFTAGGFVSTAGAGLLLLFANAVAMWRIYVAYGAEDLAVGLERSTNPGRQALVVAYTHLIMVAGVVLTAAGGETIVVGATNETTREELALMVAGPVVFLAGRTLYAFELFRTTLWRLPAGALVLVAAAPLLQRLPPIGVGAVASTVLLALAIVPRLGPRHF
ncbi:low temperature requirement protein A [Micromonospora krabiensis]|uniref:low temperature requirement protein A n=1 Tax=Micromonospora krabiensis TaxID=307121 RepID=UPI0012FD34EE|nr:low temperature requirement protein A [Micromonospora krabiensis]